MSEHTPGPWSWGPDYRGLYGSGPNNEVLTHIYYEGMHLSYGAAQAANACLIAAAPALLEALERQYAEIADIHNEWPGRNTSAGQRKLCDLRDLIATASGKSPEEVQNAAAIQSANGKA